jgi:hypothetical protein
MARRCHGRSKKAESQKLEGGSYEYKNLEWSGRPARPRTQHDCHYDTKIKPEAATAVIELLMMGGETPGTC